MYTTTTIQVREGRHASPKQIFHRQNTLGEGFEKIAGCTYDPNQDAPGYVSRLVALVVSFTQREELDPRQGCCSRRMRGVFAASLNHHRDSVPTARTHRPWTPHHKLLPVTRRAHTWGKREIKWSETYNNGSVADDAPALHVLQRQRDERAEEKIQNTQVVQSRAPGSKYVEMRQKQWNADVFDCRNVPCFCVAAGWATVEDGGEDENEGKDSQRVWGHRSRECSARGRRWW
ncbi:hypothetical protein C8F04DRAFT_1235016 [Mycena alexandri]|uniref:Uncharacterized protein n=1 Tax=Mycena alexandri TaxID=1745969 RepID=A0AAD6SS00_9AGAR|nr:hypothetical protein C8F04DRAFT_1235016 [Mycena alexandri]